MTMDIKEKISEIVETIKEDPKLLAKFKTDPVAALEGILGVDLPDEQLKPLIAGIKAKLDKEDVSELIGKIGKLF